MPIAIELCTQETYLKAEETAGTRRIKLPDSLIASLPTDSVRRSTRSYSRRSLASSRSSKARRTVASRRSSARRSVASSRRTSSSKKRRRS